QLIHELVDALGLANDRLKGPLAGRFRFVAEQVLGLSGNDGQGVIDLMTGACGQLGQGEELLLLEPGRLTTALLFQSAVELIEITVPALLNRRVAPAEVLCCQDQEIAQQRYLD